MKKCLKIPQIYLLVVTLKGEQDAAELGANTYAHHICTKYFVIFFADNFLFDANERICFLFLGISYFYINSKKEDNLTSASYLHAGHLLSQAK